MTGNTTRELQPVDQPDWWCSHRVPRENLGTASRVDLVWLAGLGPQASQVSKEDEVFQVSQAYQDPEATRAHEGTQGFAAS